MSIKSKAVSPAQSLVNWKDVGRRVRELRGLDANQAEFAFEIGISQGQLSRYEKGNSEIGAEALLRLARKSGKSIEWLLTGVEQTRKNR
jgi:transcriptional regulator with XRE-family HTH domain